MLSKKCHVSRASVRTSSVSWAVRLFFTCGNLRPSRYISSGAPHHATTQNSIAPKSTQLNTKHLTLNTKYSAASAPEAT